MSHKKQKHEIQKSIKRKAERQQAAETTGNKATKRRRRKRVPESQQIEVGSKTVHRTVEGKYEVTDGQLRGKRRASERVTDRDVQGLKAQGKSQRISEQYDDGG